jgi:hypothetical protein
VVVTPDGRFGSAKLAAEHYGIHPRKAARKAAKGEDHWFYLGDLRQRWEPK